MRAFFGPPQAVLSLLRPPRNGRNKLPGLQHSNAVLQLRLAPFRCRVVCDQVLPQLLDFFFDLLCPL